MLVVFTGPGVAEFCKWVDENGTVHYAETCPEEVDSTEIGTQAQPTQAQVEEAIRRSEQSMEIRKTQKEKASAARSIPRTNQSSQAGWTERKTEAQVDCPSLLATKSLQELEALCEQAREKQIAPLREAEIKKCEARGGGMTPSGVNDFGAITAMAA